MTLITCPECQHEISDKAEACPNCGVPRNAIGKSIKKNVARTTFVVILIVLVKVVLVLSAVVAALGAAAALILGGLLEVFVGTFK